MPVTFPIFHWRLSFCSTFRDHLFVIVAFSICHRICPSLKVRGWITERIPWIKALEETSIVGDVRGGDSFSDIYGLRRFIIATLPVLSVLAVKGTIVMFPQTYGPFKGVLSRSIAKFILRRATAIVARDKHSQRVAQELAGNVRAVRLCPDVAFALHADCPAEVELDPCRAALPSLSFIGINVNGLMFNGGYAGKNMFGLKLSYPEFLVVLIKEMLTVHAGELLLVPHTFELSGNPESDNDACQKIREMLPPEARIRVRILDKDYDPHELKGIIGKCDFFIGSRMHSCIAALSQGVPCAAVAYSMKFSGVFESVGMGDHVIDARECEENEAVEAIVKLYFQRDGRREELKKRVEQAKVRLQESFRLLVGVSEPREDEPTASIAGKEKAAL